MSQPVVFGPKLWEWTHFCAARTDLNLAHAETAMVKHRESVSNSDESQRYLIEATELREEAGALWSFLDNLIHHVPCMSCKGNFTKFLVQHPLPEIGKRIDHQFFNWSVDAHNHANALTGKLQISYAEATTLYEDKWLNLPNMYKAQLENMDKVRDHQKIKKLQQELDRIEGGIANKVLIGMVIVLVFIICYLIVRHI